jgi:hypothetical protein
VSRWIGSRPSTRTFSDATETTSSRDEMRLALRFQARP